MLMLERPDCVNTALTAVVDRAAGSTRSERSRRTRRARARDERQATYDQAA
jgi:hypothetical protein